MLRHSRFIDYWSPHREWRSVDFSSAEDTKPPQRELWRLFLFSNNKQKESPMLWTYEITIASKPRVLMRLIQVFDQQLLTISSLKLSLFGDHVKITLAVDVETELAYRIRAKLYNQPDIQNVDLHV